MIETAINYIVLPLLSISMVLVFIRVAIGPTLPDRVIALDLLVTISIGIIASYSILHKNTVFIDVALILALLAFLGTVAFAYYYEKRGKQ